MTATGQVRRADGIILAVNVGNTHATAALVRGGRVVRRLTVPTRARLPSLGRLRAELVQGLDVSGAILASVVPAVDAKWQRLCARATNGPVLTLDYRMDLGVRSSYPHPETLGADRLANICAAAVRPGAPVIAVDVGTAVTFDCIVPRRGFIGGAIAPGPRLMFDYLADRTAKLPRLAPAPCRAQLGTSTEMAIRVAATAGYPALIRGILDHLRRMPALRNARVIATGGAARAVFGKGVDGIAVDDDLTFRGLARAFALNRPAAR